MATVVRKKLTEIAALTITHSASAFRVPIVTLAPVPAPKVEARSVSGLTRILHGDVIAFVDVTVALVAGPARQTDASRPDVTVLSTKATRTRLGTVLAIFPRGAVCQEGCG